MGKIRKRSIEIIREVLLKSKREEALTFFTLNQFEIRSKKSGEIMYEGISFS